MSHAGGSIVEIVTRLRKIASGTHLIPGISVGIFLFCEASRPPVGAILFYYLWGAGDSFLGHKTVGV